MRKAQYTDDHDEALRCWDDLVFAFRRDEMNQQSPTRMARRTLAHRAFGIIPAMSVTVALGGKEPWTKKES